MTTKMDDRIARLEALIERMDSLVPAARSVVAPASINPDGSPGHVAAGELIESAWGNAVADEFQRTRAWIADTAASAGPFGATPTEVPGLSVTVDFKVGKIYQISAFISMVIPTLTGVRTMHLVNWNTGAPINTSNWMQEDGGTFSMYATALTATGIGPTEFRVLLSTSAGDMTIEGAPTRRSILMVQEISP